MADRTMSLLLTNNYAFSGSRLPAAGLGWAGGRLKVWWKSLVLQSPVTFTSPARINFSPKWYTSKWLESRNCSLFLKLLMVHSPVVGLQGSYFYNAPLIIDDYSRLRRKYFKVLTKRMSMLAIVCVLSAQRHKVRPPDCDQLGLLPPAPGSLLS